MHLNRNNQGFSLIEGIIASAILAIGISAVLTLTISNLVSTKESRSRIIAANLAREGVEVVRNMRDSGWLEGKTFADIFDFDDDSVNRIAYFDSANNTWELKPKDNSIANISDPKTKMYLFAPLYIQDVASSTGMATNFSRLITLKSICDSDDGLGTCGDDKYGLQVLSEVQWTESGKTHSLIAEERMYDWKIVTPKAGANVPPPPYLLTARFDTDRMILNWFDDSSGDRESGSYNIYRNESSGDYSNIGSAIGHGSTVYIDSPITGGESYCYKVTSVNTYGESQFSTPFCLQAS